MNILLTCCGRRNYLVRFFQEALAGNGLVFGADFDPYAAALADTDRSFLVPPVSSSEYVDALVGLCRRYEVKLLFSLHDRDLPVIAAASERFLAHGILPVASTPDVIDICLDKWRTYELLQKNGIATPPTFSNLKALDAALEAGRVGFPLIVKPRQGSSSQGVEVVGSREELAAFFDLASHRLGRDPVKARNFFGEFIVQKFLEGEEYGLDVLNDLDARYVATFVKKKLGMRAGETDRAVSVEDAGLDALGKKLGGALGHVGNLDCDLFMTSEGPQVVDLNPRFGGGYPFTHAAGANLPATILAWAEGRKPDSSWLTMTPGIAVAKSDKLGRLDQIDLNTEFSAGTAHLR